MVDTNGTEVQPTDIVTEKNLTLDDQGGMELVILDGATVLTTKRTKPIVPTEKTLVQS